MLRRLRYVLELDDAGVERLVELGGHPLAADEPMHAYLRKESEDGWVLAPDYVLEAFLDGLIQERRGAPDAAASPPRPVPLTNNGVLRRIRIALELRDTDVLAMLSAAGHRMSKSELSALFRRPDHRSYRECGDQVLRKFLRGLAVTLRPDDPGEPS